KTVVITGGGSGIGASIAKAFAAGGSTKIAVIGRTERSLLTTKHAVGNEYKDTEVLAVSGDITNAKQTDDAFQQIGKAFDKMDILVCNSASMPLPQPVLSPELDVQDWWAAFNTNVLGALHTVKAFAKHASMKPYIINISTCISHIPPLEPGLSAYAASKTAGIKVFEYNAFENPQIHVVNVHPGLVETNMSHHWHETIHTNSSIVDLSGHFCLWLVSSEADFLKSKYVWVNWDVDELKAREEKILSTDLLDTKLGGVSFVG
ncbi:NAD(P)-binding protein, partial [Tothia fuscella]